MNYWFLGCCICISIWQGWLVNFFIWLSEYSCPSILASVKSTYGLSGSGYFSMGCVQSASFNSSKHAWHSLVHSNNTSFLVSWVRGLERSENWVQTCSSTLLNLGIVWLPLGSWRWHVLYALKLLRKWLYSIWRYQVSKILDISLHKVTFGPFKLQSSFLESLKDDFQVFQMFLFSFAEYDDVIQISDSKLVKSFQDLINEGLKICWAWAKPNATMLNSYLPKGITKTIFACDPFPNLMW